MENTCKWVIILLHYKNTEGNYLLFHLNIGKLLMEEKSDGLYSRLTRFEGNE